MDAQPLYLSAVTIPGQGTHNVLYVATEHASLYAFDADTGAQLWKVSVAQELARLLRTNQGCNQVPSEIGITATPVITRGIGPNGTIYLVAMSKNLSRHLLSSACMRST